MYVLFKIEQNIEMSLVTSLESISLDLIGSHLFRKRIRRPFQENNITDGMCFIRTHMGLKENSN